MLQFIRERAQGWIAGVIVFLICIPFALWGVNSYIGGGGSADVAKVNGETLTLRQYQDAFQRYRRQLQAVLGERFDAEQFGDERLKTEALTQLIQEELVRQYAERAGLRISDEQLAATIQSFPAFQDGEEMFSPALYERRLRTTGMTPESFERQLRRDMLIEQVRHGVASNAMLPDSEAHELLALRGQQRDIAWTVIPAARFRDAVAVGEEEVEAYYEANSEAFRTEETVAVDYIDLSVDGLAKEINAPEQELRSYYEANESDFVVEEERSANHILIALEPDASESQVELAMEEAREVKRKILAGRSFEELAKEVSEDVGSRAEGGSTGYFGRGVMPPAFEEAVFSMSPGDISDPVRTEFGVHIIRLNEVKEGGAKPFEEVRAEVARAYRREKAEALFLEEAERLANITFEQPDTLAVASEELGLSIERSEPFSRAGGEGIAATEAVVEAAFSEEVLLEGNNSPLIDLADDRVVVLRVAEHEPARAQPLEQVRGRIRDQLIAEAVRRRTREAGQAMLAELRAGTTPEALAARESVSWQSAEGVGRSDPDVNRAVTRKAFELGRPGPAGAVYGGVPMGTGDYALVAVTGVHEPRDIDLERGQQREILSSLEQYRGQAEWQVFLSVLTGRADIRRFEERL